MADKANRATADEASSSQADTLPPPYSRYDDGPPIPQPQSQPSPSSPSAHLTFSLNDVGDSLYNPSQALVRTNPGSTTAGNPTAALYISFPSRTHAFSSLPSYLFQRGGSDGPSVAVAYDVNGFTIGADTELEFYDPAYHLPASEFYRDIAREQRQLDKQHHAAEKERRKAREKAEKLRAKERKREAKLGIPASESKVAEAEDDDNQPLPQTQTIRPRPRPHHSCHLLEDPSNDITGRTFMASLDPSRGAFWWRPRAPGFTSSFGSQRDDLICVDGGGRLYATYTRTRGFMDFSPEQGVLAIVDRTIDDVLVEKLLVSGVVAVQIRLRRQRNGRHGGNGYGYGYGYGYPGYGYGPRGFR